jgi:hypothetical protein
MDKVTADRMTDCKRHTPWKRPCESFISRGWHKTAKEVTTYWASSSAEITFTDTLAKFSKALNLFKCDAKPICTKVRFIRNMLMRERLTYHIDATDFPVLFGMGLEVAKASEHAKITNIDQALEASLAVPSCWTKRSEEYHPDDRVCFICLSTHEVSPSMPIAPPPDPITPEAALVGFKLSGSLQPGTSVSFTLACATNALTETPRVTRSEDPVLQLSDDMGSAAAGLADPLTGCVGSTDPGFCCKSSN